jgi:Na+/proline symporter
MAGDQLHALDYVACVGYLVAITVFGLRSSRGHASSTEEFLMAGRSMSCFTVGLGLGRTLALSL